MMALLSWLTSSTFSKLSAGLVDAYKAKQEAMTDKDRIEAEKQIAFYQAQIDLAQTSQSDKWYSPRSIMGWSAAIYVAKIVVYDTVLGLGFTPNPGEQVTSIVALVLGFYFGSKALTDVASKFFSRR